MILKASQRGGDAALAAHLMNVDDNEHIEVHAINGFMADDVAGAFQEIRATAQATNCRQYLFSLSLSPPEEANVSISDFEKAIEKAMKRLGLSGQPHVVIFHEKNARRHAHLVVSRIDADSMKAINLSFFKERLCDLSRELFLAHGWQLPQGHIDRKLSEPLNYSLEEYQVAKRVKAEPKDIKACLKKCWAQSDNKSSFEAALSEAGFVLCRGDRRGFVAIDAQGKVFSLSRWLNVKTKELKLRLGDLERLLSIEEAISSYEEGFSEQTVNRSVQSDFTTASKLNDPLVAHLDQQIVEHERAKQSLIKAHRDARLKLQKQQQQQRIDEAQHFNKSHSPLRRFWQWAVGNREAVVRERRDLLKKQEDQFELDRTLQSQKQRIELRRLRSNIAELKRQRDTVKPFENANTHLEEIIIKPDPDFEFHKSQIKKSPDYVLRLLSDKHSEFSRNDVVRELSKYVAEPSELRAAIECAMRSSELVSVYKASEGNPKFTTRRYHEQFQSLMDTASFMASNKAYGVDKKHMRSAIKVQNEALKKSVGAELSNEQCAAITHVLNRRQMACVVGLAGAGKSTMLDAARDAWQRQGYRVLGGALAGKAADGLESSSGIPSRTLHSWEYGWKNRKNSLQAGDVFVIDEAGMVGTSQLTRIVKHVKEQKAKLVLVGDPEQLQPIQAGTPFKDIVERIGFAELAEIRRQKANWQKAASIDLARGDTQKAIEAYGDHGMVEYTQSEHDAISALVEDYMIDWELHGKEKSRIALAHKRSDVFAINKAIRAARQSANELQDEQVFETDFGKRAFAQGDHIVFTRNDYDLNVRNGMLGWVTKAEKDKLTVQVDSSDRVKSPTVLTINTKRFSSFDHGYASTIHRSQGVTVDHAFVIKSKAMDQHLSYVAMTRHKTEMRVYDNNKQSRETLNLQYECGQQMDYEFDF